MEAKLSKQVKFTLFIPTRLDKTSFILIKKNCPVSRDKIKCFKFELHNYNVSSSHFRYYISTLSGLPGVRHIFRVNDVIEGSSTESTQCLTCKQTIDQGLLKLTICG